MTRCRSRSDPGPQLAYQFFHIRDQFGFPDRRLFSSAQVLDLPETISELVRPSDDRELESALLADAAHLAIFGKDGRHHSVNTLLLCNLDQMTVQRCTKPLMLPVVIHQHGKLGFVASAQLTEPTNADDFGLTSFVSVFGHQRYLAQVDIGGQPYSMVAKTLELLGGKVLPAVRHLG